MQQDISGSVRLVKRQVVKLMMVPSGRSILFSIHGKSFSFDISCASHQVFPLSDGFLHNSGGPTAAKFHFTAGWWEICITNSSITLTWWWWYARSWRSTLSELNISSKRNAHLANGCSCFLLKKP